MSRTYRRRSAWDFDASDYVYDEANGWTTVWLDPRSREYRVAKSKYHRDKKHYRSGVPSWYTNLYWQRPFRQKNREVIHRWSRNPDNIEVLAPVFKHCIGWWWW